MSDSVIYVENHAESGRSSSEPIISTPEMTYSTTVYVKLCRRCGKEFVPKDLSGTSAYSYRCESCISTKNLVKDFVNSCVIC